MDDPRVRALADEICPWIEQLCSVDRCVGTPGNAEANELFAHVAEECGFTVQRLGFDCAIWERGPSWLEIAGDRWDVAPSPYSLSAEVDAPLVVVRTLDELRTAQAADAVLLVLAPLARRQLTPVNYPFYSDDESTAISRALVDARPAAVLAATDHDPNLAGGLSPFPWIEDGDFDIPSAYLHAELGERIAQAAGRSVRARIDSRRVDARAEQLTAGKQGPTGAPRVVVAAHIDAKPGTPGALDNASGVATLMAVARLLETVEPPVDVELVPFNGEDHWAAPGELAWLARDNEETARPISLVINVDGVGYLGRSIAISEYNLDDGHRTRLAAAIEGCEGLVAGPQWYRSDHAIFAMRGTPAIAATSADEAALFEFSHTERDVPELVEPIAIARLAAAIARLVSAPISP